MNELEDKYNKICYEYIYKFAEKQDIHFIEWRGGVGDYALFNNNYYIPFNEIVYDINYKIENKKILDYQNYKNCKINDEDGIFTTYKKWLYLDKENS